MVGLGKYVDKAMELKLQYAPLNQYQMDLIENKEKYEAKLKAVEQEYKKGTSIVQPVLPGNLRCIHPQHKQSHLLLYLPPALLPCLTDGGQYFQSAVQ